MFEPVSCMELQGKATGGVYPRVTRGPPSERGEVSEIYALYRFYDATDELLYVGATTNPRFRIQTHRREKEWWQEVVTIKIQHFTNLDQLLAEERAAIEAENPRHNLVHTAKPIPWAGKKIRRQGDGTLFRRADGYWVGGIEAGCGPDGKRRHKRVVRKNKEDAVAALEELKRKYKNAG